MSRAQVWRLARLVLVGLLAGCAHPRFYADAEKWLKTDGHFDAQGHFAVYYPAAIALSFPGYVVGIELGDKADVVHGSDLVADRVVHAGPSMALVSDLLIDGPRVPIISQVIRYRGRPLGEGNCALYSLYQSDGPDRIEFCDGAKRPTIGDWSKYRSAYADSWLAIDALKEVLRKDVASGHYTHLIVAMMGWRTQQEEAIRNFNSLMQSIHRAANHEFRPLFVGVTWVGPWAGRWLDPLVEAMSYSDIAHLSDILGLTWVGVLTEEIAMPLGESVDTAFITHSFGARAAATAICIGPAIKRRFDVARAPAKGAIGHLIGFQAAFSLQRFKKDRLFLFYEDVYFPDNCARADSIVLTASAHDSASQSILWADLAGNYRYFRSFCRSNEALVSCASVNERGDIRGPYDMRKRLLYLDASELIRYRAPGTDGGAHSDIFRPATGRLLWNVIAKPAAGSGARTPGGGAGVPGTLPADAGQLSTPRR